MVELIITLAILFFFVIFILEKFVRFFRLEKTELSSFNTKYAPFLFVLSFILFILFQFESLRDFLEWLGISSMFIVIILTLAVCDNLFLFLVKERRFFHILKSYLTYFSTDTGEFFLVTILAILSSVAIYFQINNFFIPSYLLSLIMFFFVQIFLPLILFQYKEVHFLFNLNIDYNKFLLNVVKFLIAIFSLLLFFKLFGAFYSSFHSVNKIALYILFSIELSLFILVRKKKLFLPRFISRWPVFVKLRNQIIIICRKLPIFLYDHIEITSLCILILVLSIPVMYSRFREYQDWRSNFPLIIKALPAKGMQGTVIALYGNNFGTTGEGVPGDVLVGSTKLTISNWNDHKIEVSVPVPPPKGDIFIKRYFKWKAVLYQVLSNKISFEFFDWSKANQEEIESYLNLLKEQYEANKK